MKKVNDYSFNYCERGLTLIFLLLISITFLPGCFMHAFKTNTQTSVDAVTLQKLKAQQKYFVLHFDNHLSALKDIDIRDNRLEADLIDLPNDHYTEYTDPKTNKANSVLRKYEVNTLKEVHLYYPKSYDSNQTHISIPVTDFNRVDIYQFDQKATNRRTIFSIVGIVLAPVAVAAILGLLMFAGGGSFI